MCIFLLPRYAQTVVVFAFYVLFGACKCDTFVYFVVCGVFVVVMSGPGCCRLLMFDCIFYVPLCW